MLQVACVDGKWTTVGSTLNTEQVSEKTIPRSELEESPSPEMV